jgi:hypothetical protein
VDYEDYNPFTDDEPTPVTEQTYPAPIRKMSMAVSHQELPPISLTEALLAPKAPVPPNTPQASITPFHGKTISTIKLLSIMKQLEEENVSEVEVLKKRLEELAKLDDVRIEKTIIDLFIGIKTTAKERRERQSKKVVKAHKICKFAQPKYKVSKV